MLRSRKFPVDSHCWKEVLLPPKPCSYCNRAVHSKLLGSLVCCLIVLIPNHSVVSIPQEALKVYQSRRDQDPSDAHAVLGCLRCLDAVGDWEGLVDMCNDSWTALDRHSEDSVKTKAATLAAR